jgi:hypothetical protein
MSSKIKDWHIFKVNEKDITTLQVKIA